MNENNAIETPSATLARKREQLAKSIVGQKTTRIMSELTHAADEYFLDCHGKSLTGPEIANSGNPFAIVALGGYGRRELCLHSDIDLLILFQRDVPEEAEELVREIVFPLWDIGLEVGCSTRSIDDCMSVLDDNAEDLTAILDSRFLCGKSKVFSDFKTLFRKDVVIPRADEFIDWLIETNNERHLRFGDSSHLLEPNLKEGQGGLRDYHTMLWIGKIKYDFRQTRDLEYQGCLSNDEYRIMSRALSFVWFVRNRLHLLAGRRTDKLYFRFQEKLAEGLAFRLKDGQQPVERFLGRLHRNMSSIKNQHLILMHEIKNLKKGDHDAGAKPNGDGLKVFRGMIGFASPAAILESPELLFKLFEEGARLDMLPSHEAKRLVKHFKHLVDDDFRASPSMAKLFERILAVPINSLNVLHEMLNISLLSSYLPEFEGIMNRIQYDEYHLYPVDKHSLDTVRRLAGFAEKDGENPMLRELYRDLENPVPLLWAGFLHDIGKSEPGGGHSQKGAEIVRRVLERMGYDSETVDTVYFLVLEHLFLVKTATRRDINDEETAIFCARRIRDAVRLKMLYLLSVADSMSTGPKAWNEWTSSLLCALYLKVANVIEKGELATPTAVETVTRKREEILALAETDREHRQLESVFNIMSPRYFLYTPVSEIPEHIRVYESLGEEDFVWKVGMKQEKNTRTVTVCAKDAPGLISKIAGVFTLNNIDILNVRIFTWHNDFALDIFTVKPPPDRIYETEKWERAAKDLQAALKGELDLAGALEQKISGSDTSFPGTKQKDTKIVVDNTTSSFFTIVEVFSYDFPGLLYRITDALFRCEMNIWVAKIATDADQVVDVFYVRDFDGQKADTPEQIDKIRSEIKLVLEKRGCNRLRSWFME